MKAKEKADLFLKGLLESTQYYDKEDNMIEINPLSPFYTAFFVDHDGTELLKEEFPEGLRNRKAGGKGEYDPCSYMLFYPDDYRGKPIHYKNVYVREYYGHTFIYQDYELALDRKTHILKDGSSIVFKNDFVYRPDRVHCRNLNQAYEIIADYMNEKEIGPVDNRTVKKVLSEIINDPKKNSKKRKSYRGFYIVPIRNHKDAKEEGNEYLEKVNKEVEEEYMAKYFDRF